MYDEHRHPQRNASRVTTVTRAADARSAGDVLFET